MFYNDATWEIEAFAMKRGFLLLGLALAGVAFACGDSDGLTFEDVRTRALAALWRPGQVYHEVGTREAIGGGSGGFTTEAWLDMQEDVARVLEGEERLRIFHDGKIAELGPNGRFQDADVWPAPGLTGTAALSLEHIIAFFDTDIVGTTIRAAEVDGVPAILVEVVDPYNGDYSGTQKRKIYLDESFLPMRIDYHADISGAPDNEWSMGIQHEFIDPASLPDAFFSPEAVREHEVTPVDDIARSVEFGLEPYWLGEDFEDMALEDAMVMGVDVAELHEGEAEQWLVLSYRGGVVGPESPGFGVTIDEYTSEGWERRMADIADSGRTPWWEQPTVIKTTVAVQGTEATLYEDPYGLPPLNVGPEGKPSFWMLVVSLNNTVVEINPNVGDPAINPYVDHTEALVRLAEGLRPFERPPE